MAGVAIHTDGTIFAVTNPSQGNPALVGVDSASGTEKFRIPIDVHPSEFSSGLVLNNTPLIAGDGYAYLAYATATGACDFTCETNQLNLLRVSSSGAAQTLSVMSWSSAIFDYPPVSVGVLTNADTGVIVSIAAGIGAIVVLLFSRRRLRSSVGGATPVLDPKNPQRDGVWQSGGHIGGRPGELYGTSVACFVLAMPNRYLPILQEGKIDALRKFQPK